jgi:hypothetical protein
MLYTARTVKMTVVVPSRRRGPAGSSSEGRIDVSGHELNNDELREIIGRLDEPVIDQDLLKEHEADVAGLLRGLGPDSGLLEALKEQEAEVTELLKGLWPDPGLLESLKEQEAEIAELVKAHEEEIKALLADDVAGATS